MNFNKGESIPFKLAEQLDPSFEASIDQANEQVDSEEEFNENIEYENINIKFWPLKIPPGQWDNVNQQAIEIILQELEESKETRAQDNARKAAKRNNCVTFISYFYDFNTIITVIYLALLAYSIKYDKLGESKQMEKLICLIFLGICVITGIILSINRESYMVLEVEGKLASLIKNFR